MSESSNGFHRRSVRIPNGVDLHARPAGMLVRAAAQQSADTRPGEQHRRGDHRAQGDGEQGGPKQGDSEPRDGAGNAAAGDGQDRSRGYREGQEGENELH